MASFYERLALPPDAPSEQIRAALDARLARAGAGERDELLHIRATLLDPAARASYNRIVGLAEISPEAEAAQQREGLAALRAAELRANERVEAELQFALYATLVGGVVTLWLVAMRHLLPLIRPGIAWFTALQGWEGHTEPLAATLLTLPLAALAWVAINIYDSATFRAGRVLGITLLVGATMLGLGWLFGVRGVGFYGLILGGAAFMRALALHDLHEMFGPGAARKR